MTKEQVTKAAALIQQLDSAEKDVERKQSELDAVTKNRDALRQRYQELGIQPADATAPAQTAGGQGAAAMDTSPAALRQRFDNATPNDLKAVPEPPVK